MGKSKRHKPIKGKVISFSRQGATLFLVIGLIALPVGAVLLILQWYAVGFVAAFTGVVVGYGFGLRSLLLKPRLIIGTDCVQEVQREGEVVTHIPYENIAELRLVNHEPPLIGINLHDPDDADSYCSVPFGSQKEHHGFDHVLIDEFEESPKEIYRQLKKRYREVQEPEE